MSAVLLLKKISSFFRGNKWTLAEENFTFEQLHHIYCYHRFPCFIKKCYIAENIINLTIIIKHVNLVSVFYQLVDKTE